MEELQGSKRASNKKMTNDRRDRQREEEVALARIQALPSINVQEE